MLFREREVENLQNMIYNSESTDDLSNEHAIDSNRFTAPRPKLELYKRSSVKRLLKKRFVTGQGSD